MVEEIKKTKDAILAKLELWKWKNDEPYFGLAYSLKQNNDKEFFIRICRKHLTTLERIEHLKSLMLNNSMCAKLNEVQMKWLDEYSNNIPLKQKQEQTAETKLPEELNTDEAKKYFQCVIDLGFMDDNYKWLGGLQTCAYFASKMSDKLKLGKGERINWKPFEALFGVPKGKLRLNLNDVIKTGGNPKNIKLIKNIFE